MSAGVAVVVVSVGAAGVLAGGSAAGLAMLLGVVAAAAGAAGLGAASAGFSCVADSFGVEALLAAALEEAGGAFA